MFPFILDICQNTENGKLPFAFLFMEKDEKKPLFPSRKADDIIDKEFCITPNSNKDFQTAAINLLSPNGEDNFSNVSDSISDHSSLKIITPTPNAYFILFLSLLIGFAFTVLAGVTFPIYTKASFQDKIPSDLNIHGFQVGNTTIGGNVIFIDSKPFVALNASQTGLILDIFNKLNSKYQIYSFNKVVFDIDTDVYPVVVINSVNVKSLFSAPVNIINDNFYFNKDPVYFEGDMEAYNGINCSNVLLNGFNYSADGTCKQVETEITQNVLTFLLNEKDQMTSSFDYVNSFSVAYPYVATTHSNNIHIFKLENHLQSEIFSHQGDVSDVQKALNQSKTFIWGNYSIHINDDDSVTMNENTDTPEIDNFTTGYNELGLEIRVFSNSSGIFYYECQTENCSEFFVLEISAETADDITIDFDEDIYPIVLSNHLRKAFIANQATNVESFEEIELFYGQAEQILLLKYTTQLLYLADGELKRYSI
ncbi:hypothetical protein TRFO_02527 [Tritrichomonas foetus]|uniref:Uncharacterized protein n=1 Tax=Tritrichomonas foetus TaxID=1144522 RepID=A0A1J4L259_9EUKA|nr:hypothetical protein TRFO_02527 [Tritrichomonas foetus]|eukprot:OHT17498.1 hypothetical protein TRFO_02527 [Tritrichomonas foetus]